MTDPLVVVFVAGASVVVVVSVWIHTKESDLVTLWESQFEALNCL